MYLPVFKTALHTHHDFTYTIVIYIPYHSINEMNIQVSLHRCAVVSLWARALVYRLNSMNFDASNQVIESTKATGILLFNINLRSVHWRQMIWFNEVYTEFDI